MSQAYSITINLPEEKQQHLNTIVDRYLALLKNTDYVQSYEKCQSGKIHAHIAYMGKNVANTSNETKKFNLCYTDFFSKKECPNAIDHKKHNNWKLLVGYVVKDGVSSTNLLPEKIEEGKALYLKVSSSETVKKTDITDNLTINQISDKFLKWAEANYSVVFPDLRFVQNHESHKREIVKLFMSTIWQQIAYNTYAKIRAETLYEYAHMCLVTSQGAEKNIQLRKSTIEEREEDTGYI